MGFGILLIGFLLLSVGFTPLAMFTFVLGGATTLYSLKNLVYENKFFMASAILTLLHLVFSVVVLFLNFLSIKNINFEILNFIQRLGASMIFIVLMYAIFVIAKSVDLPKIQSKAIFTMISVAVSVAFMIVSKFAVDALYTASVAIEFCALILYIASGIITIFNCTARICYEDDLDMTNKNLPKPMKFLDEKLTKVMTPKEKRNKDQNDSEKDIKK